ncbi:MAG: hypothetical protein QM533_02985 [Cytophagales bacterium]|nr:hypothetical protein [Cytophagales bacterium]
MTSTVLITTATSPPAGVPFLNMTNTTARYLTAKAALFFWAGQGVERIVVADATGQCLLTDEEIILLKSMHVEVEQIHYQQDEDLIKLKGKGYGEGLLIQLALEKSVLLKDQTSFFKCTGKIYCRNFDEIRQLIENNHVTNLFWRHLQPNSELRPWADLRFFYAAKDFCTNHLIPAYLKTEDRKLEVAEQFCFDALQANLVEAKTIRPLLSGFAGWTGKLYSDVTLGELDTSCPCWVNA